METAATNHPATSTGPSKPEVLAAAPAPVAMDISDSATESFESKFELAYNRIRTNKEAVMKQSLKAIQKMFQAVQSKPDDVKNRKLNMTNIIMKKFVTEVPGAQDFFEAVGFVRVEEQKNSFLEISRGRVDATQLTRANELLERYATQEPPKPAAAGAAAAARTSGKPIDCAGGCGFFGDPNTENLCSKCHKKKYFSTPAPSSSSSSSSSSPAKAPATTTSTSTSASGAAGAAGAKPEAKTPVPTGPPKLCVKQCGFFGSEMMEGMCSGCWRKEKNTPKPKTAKQHWRVAALKLRAVRLFRLSLFKGRQAQTDTTRCWTCKRKVGITGIECRCKYVFCGKHRYPDEHDCPYDFKQLHRRKLEKENQKVAGEKVEKL